jgi:glyoxylase-like metal-dependent hydrolase (beta-lactamase superfamily II)
MRSLRLLLALPLAATALAAGCATPPPVDAPTLLREAEAALGSRELKTLVVSGSGTGATFGQAFQADTKWPAVTISKLTRSMNFETGALREESQRQRREPTGGGAIPPLGRGEARSNLFTRDGFAWGTAVAGNAAPQPSLLAQRQHELWTTMPHGALKAAAKHDAVSGVQVVAGQRFDTLSFTIPRTLQATLFLDEQRRVVRIESLMPNPVLGDTAVETEFSDWKDAEGLKYPARVRQRQAGSETLDLAVAEVKVNVPVEVEVPNNVRTFVERLNHDPVMQGVWFITGGSHNSVAIEQANQIVLIEAPQYDGRGSAVIDLAGRFVEGKSVKTVVATHHHFDQAGGLRAAVAAGATLVTSNVAKPFFEKAFANPNRIAPDRLAGTPKAAVKIVGVKGRTRLADPVRPIEIYEIEGSQHARGLLMVYLPKEKLLIQADAFIPLPKGGPLPAPPLPEVVNLVKNIERLKLEVVAVMPLHGRGVQYSELLASAGRP